MLYVIDYEAGTGKRGALFRVDSDGNRTLLSDFGDSKKGDLGVDPFAIAFDGTNLVVADQSAGTVCGGSFTGCGALFRVDPVDGSRVLLSDFGDSGQGPLGLRPYGVAVDADGNYLVADQDAGTGAAGALFRVSWADGTRTLLSDFGNPAQGPTGTNPSGIGIEGTGRILVADPHPNTPYLFGVDPDTGARVIISDFSNASLGTIGEAPINAEPGTHPDIWVLDQVTNTIANGDGDLFKVNSQNGTRSLISDFTNPAQGPIGFNVNDVKVYTGGKLLVMDFDAGTNSLGALFLVDPVTGAREYFSDFGDITQGPLGDEPCGVVYALPPAGDVTLTVTKLGTGAGYVSSNPAGIDCGPTCSHAYAQDQIVALSAVADALSTFIRWGGDPDCRDGAVQLATSKTCTAEFRQTIVRRGRGFVGRDLKWFYCLPGALDCERSPYLQYSTDTTLPTTIRFAYNLQNSGVLPPVPDQPVRVYVYLSRDRRLSADDLKVAEGKVFFPDGASRVSQGATFPAGDTPLIPVLPVGPYNLTVVIDPLNEIPELNENNNIEVIPYWICPAGDTGKNCPPLRWYSGAP